MQKSFLSGGLRICLQDTLLGDRAVIKDVHIVEKIELLEDHADLGTVGIDIFELCDIFGIVEETRAKFDVPRNMLDLEITESALNQNGKYIKSECDKMRDLGYSIWIDDFGSGYSSLNTVAEYNFDVLKLDMVFMRSYESNPKTEKLLSFIMEGARAMGVAPLCEGVETQQQFEFLKSIGCERAQGYYFGKPMPEADLLKAIDEGKYRLAA